MLPFRLALACLLLGGGVRGQQPEATTTAPPARASAPALPRVRLAGRRLFATTRGDHVHPALSPDGTRLAYSKVVMVGRSERTEILLRDLRSGRTSVLLGRRASERYATYSAFVTHIEWLSDRRLRVRVADGDVDATDLLFDARSKRLLRETYNDAGLYDDDGDNPTPMPPEFRRAHARARALFPALDDRVLRDTFYSGAFLAGGRGIVLQKQHADEDDHVWLLDFERRAMQTLLDLDGPAASYRLAGGFAFGPSILFLITNGADAILYEHRDGRTTELFRTPVRSGAPVSVEIKHASAARVLFPLRTSPTYERGDNPLLVLGAAGLRRAGDYPALYDASISTKSRLIAYSHWQGGVRRLVVNELRD